MSGDELDDAIDAAVHDIMRAEPSAGLKHRVLRSVSEPAPRWFVPAPRLAVIATLAVCLAIGAFLARRASVATEPGTPRPASPSAVESSPAVAETTTAPGASLPGPGRTSPIGAGRRPRPAPPDRLVAATSVANADAAVVIAPLDPLQAIAAAPVGAEPVQIEEITIAPLWMEPVRVDPLSSTPR